MLIYSGWSSEKRKNVYALKKRWQWQSEWVVGFGVLTFSVVILRILSVRSQLQLNFSEIFIYDFGIHIYIYILNVFFSYHITSNKTNVCLTPSPVSTVFPVPQALSFGKLPAH